VAYSKDDKKILIEAHIADIMGILGLDLTDDSLVDTPKRVAKMYVDEIFGGLLPENYPKITAVQNKFKYDQMLIENNIEVHSVCEHHLVPIVGYCHIAYIPDSKVLGLSKFNRIVRYFSQRPQVQERLTQDILADIQRVVGTKNVAVVIDAVHLCVRMRGVRDTHTITRTSALGGVFKKDKDTRSELFASIPKISDFRM
jgi:GTP cyclohydrolase I